MTATKPGKATQQLVGCGGNRSAGATKSWASCQHVLAPYKPAPLSQHAKAALEGPQARFAPLQQLAGCLPTFQKTSHCAMLACSEEPELPWLRSVPGREEAPGGSGVQERGGAHQGCRWETLPGSSQRLSRAFRAGPSRTRWRQRHVPARFETAPPGVLPVPLGFWWHRPRPSRGLPEETAMDETAIVPAAEEAIESCWRCMEESRESMKDSRASSSVETALQGWAAAASGVR